MAQPGRFADAAHHRIGMSALVVLILTGSKRRQWLNIPRKYKEINS
jgi:hypothetical protein